MNISNEFDLSPPLHLHVQAARRHGQTLSVREHLSRRADEDAHLPLVILTYHPGYAAGSYEDRDYFELLTPLLFEQCRGCCRLRVFTINHPGYDLPPTYKVDRFDLETYSIHRQPIFVEQVLRWLLMHRFRDEKHIHLLAYGHSMGGLALARTDLRPLQAAVADQGRDVAFQKVLSAPAFILRETARKNLGRLNALDRIKRTFGRVPLYESVARSLFTNLAPILYRRDAEDYSLNPDCTFIDFPRYNPFILLEQGRELCRLNYGRARLARLLNDTHLLVYSGDGMVDTEAMLRAAGHANSHGLAVQIYTIDSSHNAERDDPHLVRDAVCTIMRPFVNGEAQSSKEPAFA